MDWNQLAGLLAPVGSIILADLVLSGDNALVIGAAAAGLEKRTRWWAILLGGGSAVILRIAFTILAAFLLEIPLLQTIGGLILIYIAIKLLFEKEEKEDPEHHEAEIQASQSKKKGKSFFNALITILVADVTMSLDNVLAVGALSHGHIGVLIFGLIVSIGFLLLSSAVISAIMSKLPWLIDVASLILAWTAASMILEDQRLGPWLMQNLPYAEIVIRGIVLVIVLGFILYVWWMTHQKKQQKQNGDSQTTSVQDQTGEAVKK